MPLRMIAASPMMDRLISASIALVLGFLVWLYARSRDEEMLDNVPIPVNITLAAAQADQYDLQITGSSQVTAAFAGPPVRMRELRGLLQRGGLRVAVTFAVPPDRLSESRFLDTVRIDAGDIHPPPGVRATVVEGRNRIPVTLRRLVERRLPVRLDTALEERISQIVVEPATVQVRGPQDILERTRAVPTHPYVLPVRNEAGLQDSITATSVPLMQELEGRPIKTTPRAVAVRLTLQARQKVYEVVDVPVQFLCPANFSFRPEWINERDGKINLRLIGPVGEERPTVSAYIDLTRRKFEAGGLYPEEPVRLQLPRDFQLSQGSTPAATFRLKPLN